MASSPPSSPPPTHGHRRGPDGQPSPTYYSWSGMIQRCTNKNHAKYSNYGGRGISIDPRWLGREGFIHFLADMGERPEGKTLDRLRKDEGYCKDNCAWSSDSEQNFNRRWWFRKKDWRGRFIGSDDAEDGTGQGATEFEF